MSSKTSPPQTLPKVLPPKDKGPPQFKHIPKIQRNPSVNNLDQTSSAHNKLWKEVNLIFKYPFDYFKFIKEYLLSPMIQSQNPPKKPNSPNRVLQYVREIKETLPFHKRLLNYLFRSKTTLFLAMLSLILTTLSQIKLPELVGQIIDAVVLKKNFTGMIDITKQFLLVCSVYAICEFLYNYTCNLLSTHIELNLKKEVFSGIIQRSMPYFDQITPSEISNSLEGKVHAVQNICTKELFNFLRNTIIIISTSWTLIITSSKLTIFLITIIPIYLILSVGYSILHENAHKGENESYQKTSTKVLQTFQQIKLIKSFSTEQAEIDKYQELLQENKIASHKKALLSSVNIALSGFLTNGTLLLVIYMGMTLVNVGDLTPGELCSYILFIIVLSSSFRDAGRNSKIIKGSLPICKDLFALLDANSQTTQKSGRVISNFQGEVTFRNVNFSYPRTSNSPSASALKGMSFRIATGDKIAFVGAKGSGKSTIISLLMRFYEDFTGDIKLQGADIKSLDVKWLRQQLGYVSQDAAFVQGTVEQNITYGIEEYSNEKLLRIIKLANVSFIFNRNLFPEGLQTKMNEDGKLSEGQKRRILIARSLMRDPKVLIFDDFTNGLDIDSELEVQNAIDNLVQHWQKTMILVSTKLLSVVKCKTIFVLSDGKIVEQGSHKELITKGSVYKNLFEKQFELLK